jgi:hypothetical protein
MYYVAKFGSIIFWMIATLATTQKSLEETLIPSVPTSQKP